MKAKTNPPAVDQEAAALRALMGERSKVEFARRHAFPGGASMISQHLHGRRPINLEHGLVYAEGLGVTLDRISPRLVQLVRRALAMLPERQEGDNVLALAERAAPAYVTPWPFKDVTREDWRALTSDQVALVEGMVRQMVPARQSAVARAHG